MKKFIKWTVILIIVILLLITILPFFFKDEIVNAIKKEANKNLTAQLDFENVSLNLFSNFPNLTLKLNEINIINKSPFEGDTLLKVEELRASVNIISLLKSDEIRINSISIKEPHLLLFKLKDGSENYNIFNHEIEETEKSEEKPLNIKLKELIIENAKFAYFDQFTNNFVAVNNYNQVLLSEFSDSVIIHDVKSSADEFTVAMNGIKFLNKLNYQFILKYSENLIEQKFDMLENEFRFNNLLFKINGYIKLVESGTKLNFGFETARSDFNDILSLIPSFYKKNIKNLQSSGKIEIKGNINGLLSDSSKPSFNVKIKVEDGNVRDKEINVGLNNVNIAMSITNPNGEFDNTIVDINKFDFLLGNKPFLGTLQIKKPESGPIINSKINGEIDLSELNNLLTFESVKKIEGNIFADLQAKGNLSKIDENNFENFSANGKITINNFLLKSNLFDYEINVPSAGFNFTPSKLVVTNIETRIGESDIKANGELLNIFDFYFNKGILKGRASTNSTYFNLNQFIGDENSGSTNADSINFSAPIIPPNVNLIFYSKFEELIF